MADDYAAREYGIRLLTLGNLINEIRESVKENPRGHRDDILRVIELSIQRKRCWRDN